jgi:hypothetical protein
VLKELSLHFCALSLAKGMKLLMNIVFLASEKAKGITGKAVVIGGGYTAQ